MANLPMEEDKWGDIAVNDPARRANYSGVTGAQTGYCTDTLDELWASAPSSERHAARAKLEPGHQPHSLE